MPPGYQEDQGDADRLADDISRKYPYPLAATYWRAFYAAANADESHEFLLDLYEITLKYCAAIAVSQYIADGVNDAKINQDLQHLQRPSLGHWQGWLRDILMLYHRTKRHLVVPELATFYMRSDAAGLLQAYQTLQRQVEHQSNISKGHAPAVLRASGRVPQQTGARCTAQQLRQGKGGNRPHAGDARAIPAA